jgi:hypothetical protein
MTIEVVPYTRDRVPAVVAFNLRMREGGTSWGWYESCEDEWLPPRPGQRAWREHFLAIENGSEVRGAYALKSHEWHVRGKPLVVTDWQGPVSEGLLSPRYNSLGLRLLRDMLKRRPLLYSWGQGGEEKRLLQMLRSLHWQLIGTPFCLRVLRPRRFLRRNGYLRQSARNRLLLDALALSGAGSVGLRLLHGLLSLRARRSSAVESEVVERFGEWADALWQRCLGRYDVVALRDAATLNAVMPVAGWPPAIRLRVRRAGQDIGWAAVMDNQLHDDPRFGDLRVGTVIDCLALPEDAEDVIAAASRFLTARGVDFLCSNQSHPRWVEAFARNGYVILRDRRYFVISPQLGKALEPLEEARKGLHLTNLDGHGPHGF